MRRAVEPDADSQLRVNIVINGAQSLVAVRGEIDLATAPLLEATIRAAIDQGCTQVLFDASGVAFMDCSGLRSILGAAERLGRDGGDLVIRSPSAHVTRLLDLTGVDAIVHIERPVSSAPDSDDGLLATAQDREATNPARTDAIDAALSAVVVLAVASIMGADSDGQGLAWVFAAQPRRSSATVRWSIPPSSSRHACKPHSRTVLSSRKPKGC